MVFFYDSGGNVINLVLNHVYQNSNNANEVIFIAPFSSNVKVTVSYTLPNGVTTTEDLMSLGNPMTVDETTINVWSTRVNYAVTQYAGNVRAQFYVYDGQTINATASSIFTVQKGNVLVLPEEPTEEVYQLILNYLASIDNSNIKNGFGVGSLQQEITEDGEIKGSKSYGKYSVALNKDNKSYQRSSFANGGGNEVGLTEEEFLEKYPNGLDETGSNYEKSNSFGNVGGQENKVKGRGSHIGGGYKNRVYGDYSGVLAGGNNIVNEEYSGVLSGNNNIINASNSSVYDGSQNEINGDSSGAGGVNNRVDTSNTHVFGVGLKATKLPNSTHVGKYNKETFSLFSVGNGSSDEQRSNAFEVYGNGTTKVFKTPTTDDEIVRLKDLRENNVTLDNEYVKKVNNLQLATILLGNYQYRVPRIETAIKTIYLPYDTNIVDKRLPNGYKLLRNPNNYQPLTYTWTLTTSAVCIYYDINTESITSFAMTNTANVDAARYILLFAIRTGTQSTVACTCPCYIDNRLFGETDVNNLNRNVVKYNPHIRVIAHRGLSINITNNPTLTGTSDTPENTLIAYKIAKQRGFEYAECDVQFTSDGVPVIIHDTTINRTARNADGTEISGTINIRDITYEQALTYDFGVWKSSLYAGEKIPTFEQFCQLCKRVGIKPYVELKTGTEAQILQLVSIIKRYRLQDNTTWVGFSDTHLSYIKNALPNARLGVSCATTYDTTLINKIKGLKTDANEVFGFLWYNLTSNMEIVEEFINEDIPIEVYGNHTENTVFNVVDNYVSGYCVDGAYVESMLYNNYIK